MLIGGLPHSGLSRSRSALRGTRRSVTGSKRTAMGRSHRLKNSTRSFATCSSTRPRDLARRFSSTTRRQILEQTIDAGIRMLDVFLERVSLPARVIGVEVPFVIELVDQLTGEVVSRPLIGAIDALVEDEHAACVVELKTAKRRWSSDQLDYDPQMTAYAMAARELGYVNPKLALVVATKTKTPDVQIERLVRHQNDERELVETAFTLERAIEAGVDTRVRGWACKTCPYSEACAA